MASFIDIASGVISQASARVEVSAQNIANTTTPGYKRRLSFETVMGQSGEGPAVQSATDFTVGKPVNTGNPYDIALTGKGFFVVKTDSGLAYTRNGQFHKDADGRLVNAQGCSLQLSGGGDVMAKGATFQVLADGTVLQDGQPEGKLDVVALDDPQAAVAGADGSFTAADASVSRLDTASVRQGAYEASNVTGGQEMVSIMQALRQAEAGQHLVNVYDDLMGRVIGTLGQAGGS